MRRLLATLIFCLISTSSWAQCTGVFPANTFCGNNTGSAAQPKPVPGNAGTVTGPLSSKTGDLATWNGTGGTAIVDSANGVFNVRLSYGAVGDNSTDNSTAITNAFAASNAYTPSVSGNTLNANGSVPTIYFDCGSSTTTCVYKYGGSGTSPINPTIPTTILCAPGVTLNYTGTAHAADIGGDSNSLNNDPWLIQGCRFTGGGSATAGIYFHNGVQNSYVRFNTFTTFGSTTAPSLVYVGNNFQPSIIGNLWFDNDGITRPMVDMHTVVNGILIFTHNTVGCFNVVLNQACSTSTYSYGIWTVSGRIDDNNFFAHFPEIRISSCGSPCGGNGNGIQITNNYFEGQVSGGPTPFITYGDPGGPQGAVGQFFNIANNFFFGPMNSGISMVGPETPVSGKYTLQNTTFSHNFLSGVSSAPYFNTNGGTNILADYNTNNSGVVNQLTTPPLLDTGVTSVFYPGFGYAGATELTGLTAWDPTGQVLNQATWTQVSSVLQCKNTAASNAMTCNTAPEFTGGAPGSGGYTWNPVTGNFLIFTSTFTNTGAVTLAVNTASAQAVHKNNGQALTGGEITANIPVLLTWDGTSWDLPNSSATTTLGPLTFATLPASPAIGTMTYISDGLAANCADGTCTTWGTNVTGGTGALKLLIWRNGTNWTLVGK